MAGIPFPLKPKDLLLRTSPHNFRQAFEYITPVLSGPVRYFVLKIHAILATMLFVDCTMTNTFIFEYLFFERLVYPGLVFYCRYLSILNSGRWALDDLSILTRLFRLFVYNLLSCTALLSGPLKKYLWRQKYLRLSLPDRQPEMFCFFR